MKSPYEVTDLFSSVYDWEKLISVTLSSFSVN